MSSARPAKLCVALLAVGWLAVAAGAFAAQPRKGAFYTGGLGRGVGFLVTPSGKMLTFRGRTEIGVACGPNKPPTGSALGQVNLNRKTVPPLKVLRDGSFQGVHNEAQVSVYIVGRFIDSGNRLVFVVRTGGGGLGRCESAKYTLHRARLVKRHK